MAANGHGDLEAGARAVAGLEAACAEILERLRWQLDREPGARPTVASVEALPVRLPRMGGDAALGSLATLNADRHGVAIQLADASHGQAVQRALEAADMAARAGESEGWMVAVATPQLGRRLEERSKQLAMAAREAMREARRRARKDHSTVDWSGGSKASQAVDGVMRVFETAADELAQGARERASFGGRSRPGKKKR